MGMEARNDAVEGRLEGNYWRRAVLRISVFFAGGVCCREICGTVLRAGPLWNLKGGI